MRLTNEEISLWRLRNGKKNNTGKNSGKNGIERRKKYRHIYIRKIFNMKIKIESWDS